MSFSDSATSTKNEPKDGGIRAPRKISLDWWTVIVALIACILILVSVVTHVPW